MSALLIYVRTSLYKVDLDYLTVRGVCCQIIRQHLKSQLEYKIILSGLIMIQRGFEMKPGTLNWHKTDSRANTYVHQYAKYPATPLQYLVYCIIIHECSQSILVQSMV